MSLGGYPQIGLAEARRAAADAHALIARGLDPVEARKKSKKAAKIIPLFKDLAKEVILEEQAKSSNANVRRQWAHRLGEAYCKPILTRPINEITATDIARLLKPHWTKRPEASKKLRIALHRLFETARILLRDEHGIAFENPARWDDLKAMGFAPTKQLSRGRHPSLPYAQMPAFMAALRQESGIAARMLEFVILTNLRSGAARLATWKEFDLDGALWTVPLSSLKDREHRAEAFRVPLSPRALVILREMSKVRVNDLVFPSPRGKVFTDMAMLVLMRRMNATSKGPIWVDPADDRSVVPHGFRASFKTWCEETATFPHSVVEEAMGHAVGNAVERAYKRTDLLEQRRKLMDAWSAHCEPKDAKVIVFPNKSA
jgi:integrase